MAKLKVAVKAQINMRLLGRIEQAEEKALYRAGAYVRGVARRLVRTVKNRAKHGLPQQPWLAHTPEAKNTISFAVDKTTKTVFIGMERMDSGKVSPEGKPVSEVLEHGGIPALINNPFFRRREQLTAAINATNFVQGVYAYYHTDPGARRYHSAPAFAGVTPSAALAARARASAKKYGNLRGGRVSRRAVYAMRSYAKDKTIYVAPIKLTTMKQAEKVAATLLKWQGAPFSQKTARRQEPRPLIRLAWTQSEDFVRQLFRNLV